ncbi:MAG: hypothetical protein IT385_05720 [Deltaproteobacteria bacterium]|nr:hypothetical protein [Deltaproteobacteria bacterium]
MRSCGIVYLSALLGAGCAEAPAFQSGEDADVESSTDTASTTQDAPADQDDGEPCGGLCLAGELCVEGACQSCAPACAALAASGMCGTDGCGGACGCASAGPCVSGMCECTTEDCVDVVVTSGAASPALAFGLRDAPLIGYVAGDGTLVARTFAFAHWDGVRFQLAPVDELAPAPGTSSILEAPDGLHILHQGAATAPERPRHLVRARGAWSARTLGAEPCVEPRLARAADVLAGCFHPESAVLSLWRWDPAGSSWAPLPAAPAIPGLPDERDWAVGADGRIYLAFVERRELDVAALVKYLDYEPGRGWSRAGEVATLENIDELQGHGLRVVVDATGVPHIFVRDHSQGDPAAASSLNRLWPGEPAWHDERVWSGGRAGAARFAVGARRGGGFDVVLDDGDPADPYVVHRVRLLDDDAWIDGGAWPLGGETLDGIALAHDASGEPRVVLTTDRTLLRYWSPLGPSGWR